MKLKATQKQEAAIATGVLQHPDTGNWSLFFRDDGILCKVDDAGVVTEIELTPTTQVARSFNQSTTQIQEDPGAVPVNITYGLINIGSDSFFTYDSIDGEIINTSGIAYEVRALIIMSFDLFGPGATTAFWLGLWIDSQQLAPLAEIEFPISDDGGIAVVSTVVTVPPGGLLYGTIRTATGVARPVTREYCSFEVRQW